MRRLLCHALSKLRGQKLLLCLLVVLVLTCVAVSQRSMAPLPRDSAPMIYAPQSFTVYSVEQINEMFRTSEQLGFVFQTTQDFVEWVETLNMSWKFSETLMTFCLGALLSAFLLASDFESRAVNTALYRGYARGRVFAAQAVFYYGFGLLLSLITAYLSIFTSIENPAGKITAGELLVCTGLRAVSDLAVLSLPFLIAYLFRDLFRTAALSAGYAILLLYRMPGQLGRTTFLTRLLSRFPACQLQDVVWFGDYTIEKNRRAFMEFPAAFFAGNGAVRRTVLPRGAEVRGERIETTAS